MSKISKYQIRYTHIALSLKNSVIALKIDNKIKCVTYWSIAHDTIACAVDKMLI
jgi:hypothetical protein